MVARHKIILYNGDEFMAKKKVKAVSHTHSLPQICSFWGVVLSAASMFIGFFVRLLEVCGITISWSGTLINICTIISMVALLVAVALPAYGYVRDKTKAWKIVYCVSLVLYICGIVGIGLSF